LRTFSARARDATCPATWLIYAAPHSSLTENTTRRFEPGRETPAGIPGARHVVIPGIGHDCCIEDPAAFDAPVITFRKDSISGQSWRAARDNSRPQIFQSISKGSDGDRLAISPPHWDFSFRQANAPSASCRCLRCRRQRRCILSNALRRFAPCQSSRSEPRGERAGRRGSIASLVASHRLNGRPDGARD
jgi:hypothetical protein